MRTQFVNEMKNLNEKLITMGKMVEDIIEFSVKALARQDLDAAKKVYEMDDKIDEIELDIENQCMRLIALQQPMAKDLRVIGTIMKIITDLERMGDHAVNIAKVTLQIGDEPLIKPLVDIPNMASLSQSMVRKCLQAFTNEDVRLAREVACDDEAVDEIYEDIYTELLEMMIKDQKIINQATRLLFIARYLERIADHATNIGERIIYMVTGERVEIN
ncbi:phosphate uptake regulator, PhoU [Alkalithermobacter thermoalcaliphilus JW-YL-7 = DSM 7308]|uniref:Phosphate-specific transport system accessory protein PhoU n=1 Tax=Alkalithermobacter thermoalcaliphilus JW-YL-7 = DSM 7308 TaxID=1121328 RepID=A0A150FSW1_CLOPD|nr:phosphate uptake regulator, PhoU [[Clostridium] paradoxum JW-YL-7 = DSM 7308]SHL34414.1 phosphate uptake regulator, PhoU [[Clostridium] paradoxum JW-YL-7 = DSM 7308]